MLQGAALAREAMASAAVCLYASVSLPYVDPLAMALQLACGLFVGPHTECLTDTASAPSSGMPSYSLRRVLYAQWPKSVSGFPSL